MTLGSESGTMHRDQQLHTVTWSLDFRRQTSYQTGSGTSQLHSQSATQKSNDRIDIIIIIIIIITIHSTD